MNSESSAEIFEQAKEILTRDIAKPRDIAWACVSLLNIQNNEPLVHNEYRYRKIAGLTDWIVGLGLQTRTADGMPSKPIKGVQVAGINPDDFLMVRLSEVKQRAFDQGVNWPMLLQLDRKHSANLLLDENGENLSNANGPATKKISPIQQELSKIVEMLEQYAKDASLSFDRKNMPGPCGNSSSDDGSFHWLCAKLDSRFSKAKKTFKDYRAGICTFQKWAKKTDFYTGAYTHFQSQIAPKSADKKTAKNHLNLRNS